MNDTILTSGLQDAELETTQNDDADWNVLFGSGYVLVTAV
jgi:hypothetical protein